MSKKKSKANVEKLVDARARGQRSRGQRSEKGKSRGGELDTRASKTIWIKQTG